MTDIYEPATAMHRTRYHVIPLTPGRDEILDERSHPTAAHAAYTYSRDLHYQQLPAVEPGDLLYTELVYAGRLTTAQWWTADAAGLGSTFAPAERLHHVSYVDHHADPGAPRAPRNGSPPSPGCP